MGAGGSVQTGLSEGVRRHCASEFERLCPRDRDFLLLAGAARGHLCARGGLQSAGSSIGLLSAPCLRAFFVAHLRSESCWIVFCLQKFGSCSRCRTGRSTWATSAPFSCWITTTMAASRCRCAARDTPAPFPHAYALPFRPPGTWTLMIGLRVRGRNCWTLLPSALSRPTNSATANFR